MSRFKNLTERLDGRAGAGDPERPPVVPDPENPDKPKGEPDPDPETNDEEANMADETPLEEREDYKAGVAAGMKSATDRINTVFAHEDTKGSRGPRRATARPLDERRGYRRRTAEFPGRGNSLA